MIRASRRLRAALLAHVLEALCVAAAAAQTTAPPFNVTLAPDATSIRWTLDTTLHTVHGTFKLKSGSFRVDPSTGDASGLIVIDAASGESGDSARDNRMHKIILESARYPEIAYRPTHITGRIDLATEGDVIVDGVFSLHGSDHPLQITVHLHSNGVSAKLATHFTIPFVAWGLKDPSTFVFRTDKQVALDIDAAFTPAPDHGPARAILHPGEVHTAQ